MDMLHNLFHRYDCLCEKHGIFKVETIGDGCVMAAGDVFRICCQAIIFCEVLAI